MTETEITDLKKNIKNVQYNTPNYFENRGYIFDKEKYYAQKQEYLNQKINMKNMEKRISLTYGDIFRIIIKINGFSLQLQNGLQL